MSDVNILLVLENLELMKNIKEDIFTHSSFQINHVRDLIAARTALASHEYEIVIIEDSNNLEAFLSFLEQVLSKDPTSYVILIGAMEDMAFIQRAIREGVSDFLVPPLSTDQVLEAIEIGLSRQEKIRELIRTRASLDIGLLDITKEIKELGKIGRSVTASLDLDRVLKIIVDSAVKLTNAEEGSLLILDEESGELQMRAARNFQEDFVRTFRLPVRDTLAGEVIRRGTPIMINEDTPQKIKTKYLVRALMYVPLKIQNKVIGVLGVDNRASGRSFTEEHLILVSTLADYAVTAIENARLYRNTEVERQKLDSILKQIEDGVIVVDTEYRIILINRTAKKIFNLSDETAIGKPLDEIFEHDGLVSIFTSNHDELPFRGEIELENGYSLNIHLVEIPDVGLAVTIQDISYFRELDRIKTDFVNTVSHDLRSPLTAILGYVELITRVGEINEQQRAFIKRVQFSVRYITELINDLLELGRIEAGFDSRREYVPLKTILEYAVDNVINQVSDYEHKILMDISADVPDVFGDPVRLRQVVDNLLSNAIRYSPNGGQIIVRLKQEDEQIILQVEDSGLGIPYLDQTYIFDRFYRGGNVPENVTGSGLGLAIVKSIVENHQGRVWVESIPGEGSCFTVVLPIPDISI